MSLFNQLTSMNDAGDKTILEKGNTVSALIFCAGIAALARGDITEAAFFEDQEIDPSDNEIAAIRSAYAAASDKTLFLDRLERLMVLAEQHMWGHHVKTKFSSSFADIVNS